MSTPVVYSKLDDLLTAGVGELVVGHEQPGKYFTFTNYRNFTAYAINLCSEWSRPKFNSQHHHHEVVHKYCQQRKVVFDIDMKRGNAELFQSVVDSLITALLDILPGLNLEKEIAFCTSHGGSIYSAHIILQRLVRNDTLDLAHLYKLVEEKMGEGLFRYVDPSFRSFNKNLRMLCSVKGDRYKRFNLSWFYREREIKTSFEDVWYYPVSELNLYESRFFAYATTLEDPEETLREEGSLPNPWSLFRMALLTSCYGLKYINFHLPPPEKKTVFSNTSEIDVEKVWDLVCAKYPDFPHYLSPSPEGFGEKGFFALKRITRGFCPICMREHDKEDSFLFIKGEEQSILLGCHRAKEEYRVIGCLKPELKGYHDEGEQPLQLTEPPIKDKMYVEPLDNSSQAIVAPMGMGKTRAMKEFVKAQPPRARILVVSPRVAYSHFALNLFKEEGVHFSHYLEEKGENLWEKQRLILQIESLYRIGETIHPQFEKPYYNILILDEFSSLMAQFKSPTMDDNRYINHCVFSNLVRDCGQVIAMDALLHQNDLVWLKTFCPEMQLKFYINPNPQKRTAIKLLVDKRNELIEKLIEEAEREVKGRRRNIYVASYSKEFTKEAEVALLEREISVKAYHGDLDDKIRKEDLGDVNISWRNYQVVLASPVVGPGINFDQDHFDVAFSVIGRGSGTVEEQFQLLHRVRHLSENKLFFHIEKEGSGEGKVPTTKQIAEDLLEKFKRGKEESPKLATMPRELRQHFIVCKQREIRTMKRLGEEVNRMLELYHYKIEEEEEVKIKDCPDHRLEAPNIEDIKDVNPEELKVKIKGYKATAEDKEARIKNAFKKVIEAEGETENSLWKIFYKNPSKRPICKQAYFEKNSFDVTDLQIKDSMSVWAELSLEYRPRFQVIERLNKALGLESSFMGREQEIPREEFLSLVLPILRDTNVQTLYKFKIKEEEEIDAKKVVNLVNKIYQNWTGKAKVFNGKQIRKRVNGERVSETPLILRETTFGNKDEEFVLWNFIRKENGGREEDKEVDELFAQAKQEFVEDREKKLAGYNEEG